MRIVYFLKIYEQISVTNVTSQYEVYDHLIYLLL